MQRMAALGATQLLVETDDEPGPAVTAYQAAGFRPSQPIWLFRKDFSN
jgi:hypothetical protein